MSVIQEMPVALANQIAAGEVIERPSSVVKELVENAIDAESKNITIELTEAGIQRIRVIDDGIGILLEDLPKAFLPHATSKLKNVYELFNISTLGFRGEALASIASIAKVHLVSRHYKNTMGGFLEIEGSQIVNQGQLNARQGTKVTVDSLFYNTPARLKHLKTLQTELRNTLKYVQNIALAFPSIRFQVFSDGKRIFQSLGNNDLRQAIANVYQPTIARKLISFSGEDEDFRIHGYISPPELTRTTKQYMHWFINSRPVSSYILDRVLLDAYGKRLMIGRYPVSVIHVNLDPKLVDVNVHPTKQTVRLSKEKELSLLITNIIENVLDDINPIPDADENLIHKHQSLDNKQENFSLKLSNDSRLVINENKKNYLNDNLNDYEKKIDEKSFVKESKFDIEDQHIENQKDSDSESLSIKNKEKVNFNDLRYVGQIHGTYLIAESIEGFYLIDQHAAQERIRYETLLQEEYDPSIQQQLLMPLILKFSPSESLFVNQNIEKLKSLGLNLHAFGPTSFQIESYPDWIDSNRLEKTIYEIIELISVQPELTIHDYLEEAIIMQSCRGAIKANHYLNEHQAKALIQQMNGLKDPYHCPHGRPIFIAFNEKLLERLFKRIQDSHQGGYYYD